MVLYHNPHRGMLIKNIKKYPPTQLVEVYQSLYNFQQERCPGIAGTTPGRCRPQSHAIKAGIVIIQCSARKRKDENQNEETFCTASGCPYGGFYVRRLLQGREKVYPGLRFRRLRFHQPHYERAL